MSERTAIAWTDHTFNIAWGCTKVSPGCAHCYAEKYSTRYDPSQAKIWGAGTPRRVFGGEHWSKPLAWNRQAEKAGERRRVFSSSMCDIWEDHPTIDHERGRLWQLIEATPWLDWQLLTKRPERILGRLPNRWGLGWPNVWLGVSIENNNYVWRADELRKIPAAIWFVSYEPALGPLDELELDGIGWMIYGGESGPEFRGHDLKWPRAMRHRCAARGIPFFFKQSPAYQTERRITLDGAIVREYPASLISQADR